jgi:hypothetical protein
MDAMLLFAAAIAATAPTNSRTVPAVVAEATATVQIVSGVRLKLDSPTNADAPPARDSKVEAEGKLQPARLIEFE